MGFVLLTGCGLLAAGCKPREEIRRYQVLKSETATTSRAPHSAALPQETGTAAKPDSDRLLAAAVSQSNKVWLFKLAGPKEAISPQADAFRGLLRSLQFADGKPQWKLPEGWRAGSGSIFRFATLEIDSAGQKLELTVIPEDKPSTDETAYLLSNVNRWRGQLGLPKIAEGQLAKETEQLQLEGSVVTLVDLIGRLQSGGTKTAAATAIPAESSAPSLSSQTPAGWKPGERFVSRGGITLRHEAAYEITDGDRRVEVTVDRLPGQMPLLQNINRWRGQIKLAPLDEKELAQQLRKLEIGDLSADYVELVGPTQSVLGAVLVRGGEGWYVKLTGDPELTQREKQNFESFVKSFKFQ
ncbi:MAG: hypothetical protein NTY19_39015 [Planctomycetota bacterium]|nr:hypothetical protein [Planctomycetota bacterium]